MHKFISYIRVSTREQGASGLGLEGQQAAVSAYAASVGGEILREYREVESGRKADRPELARALAHARRANATLVIAKLDRLARNVHFLSGMMESGVDFVACDNPTANRLTLHILAAVAEDEARRIAERTRSALAAYKARGGTLGGARPEHPGLTREARLEGTRAASVAAAIGKRSAYEDLLPEVMGMRTAGLSLRAIARRLDADGYTTRQGKPWNPQQVARVLALESVTTS
jgi:DNA invertase Pin-like site-specific DNA recombinase